MSLYFLDISLRNRSTYTHIYQEFYLVKDIKTSLLENNNILVTKKVIVDFANKTTIISSYVMTIFVTTRSRDQLVQKKVFVNRSLIIPPKYKILI